MCVFTAHLAEIAVSVAFLAFWEFLSSPLAFCFRYFEPFEKKVYQLQQFSLENEEKKIVFLLNLLACFGLHVVQRSNS